MPAGRTDLWACGLLAALWLAPALVVGLQGEFPLNDDWAYALATQRFVETGDFVRPRWTWTPVVTHVGLGALASSLFGFSFEVLRATGLALGGLGVWAAYALCRAAGAPVLPSAICAAAIALGPVYLNLSYTFMTDVPFAAMVFASLACLVHALRIGSLRWIGLGIALALAATLSRQSGIALPIALGAASLPLVARRGGRTVAAVGIGGAVVIALLFAGYRGLLEPEDRRFLFGIENFVRNYLTSPHLAFHLLRNSLSVAVYLGLFLSPVALLSLANERHWRPLGGGCGLAAAAGVVTLEVAGLRMPLGLNVVSDLALGPQELFGEAGPESAPAAFWWGVTALGLWSALVACAVAIRGLWRRRRSLWGRPDLALLIAFPVVYLLPHMSRSPFFDRYLLAAVAPLGALLLVLAPEEGLGNGRQRRVARWLAVAVAGLLGLWSVAGTRDYLEHHRARWRILMPLVEAGVPTQRIDGGFEFSGWFNSESERSPFHPERWRWFEEDEYVLSYESRLPGYVVEDRVSWARWLPPARETLTLHHRAD